MIRPEPTYWANERVKCVKVPFYALDSSEDSYKSREQWKRDFGRFSEGFYEALEMHSMDVSKKEHKNRVKKEKRKGKGKKGRKK